jgi:predicted nucleic acid-binding Zn ribbon protein
MPLREYVCKECGKVQEHLVRSTDPEPLCDAQTGPKTTSAGVVMGTCDGALSQLLTAPGGYQMNSGGSSTRPRRAGSFKRIKNT